MMRSNSVANLTNMRARVAKNLDASLGRNKAVLAALEGHLKHKEEKKRTEEMAGEK